jgi:CheY-like chemotaxis protein
MKILVLEDDRFRAQFFIERFGDLVLTITESAHTAIDYLKKETYDFIFLDNDLGINNGEGKDVADFLQNNPTNQNNHTNIVIHSWNSPAASYMKAALPLAVVAPFDVKFFKDLDLTNWI